MTKKEKAKDRRLRNKYGISLSMYNKMLKMQGYSCAICKRHESNFKNGLAVEHDHISGLWRGLCCYTCNKFFIGRHTEKTVVKLVDYLLPEYKLVKK